MYTSRQFKVQGQSSLDNIAVVIPAMNEEASIGKVIRDVQQHLQCMIVVVDDASLDRTVDVARNAGAIVLPQVVNLGAWRATQTGLRFAFDKGVDCVITMDADGQHRASDIPKLVSKIEDGYEFVVGACITRGTTERHIAWRFFRALTGLPIKDLTSGFRCYSRLALDILIRPNATMIEYQDIGVLTLLCSNRLQCCEVEVDMNEREDGISRIFHSWTAVYKYLVYSFVYSISKLLLTNIKGKLEMLTTRKSG